MKAKIICPFFIILVFFCVSCATKKEKTFTSRKAGESLSLAPEERGFAIDAFLLLDQSGSMNGSPGHPPTDPQGLRIDASKYLVRNIASKSDETAPNQVGIVNFGSTTPGDINIPLTKVTKSANDEGATILGSSLKILSLGDTSFISALKAAQDGFIAKDTFGQKRKPVIIIFTDGEPDDSRKLTQEAYFKEINDFISASLQPQGCDIYIVGIDAAGTNWVKSAPVWKRVLPEGHVYQISNMAQLQEQFNQAIRRIFGIPLVPPDVITSKGLEFDVPPYLEKLEFHIFPEKKGLTLSIFGPDGKAIDKSSPKVSVREYENYDIIAVSDPAHGKWKYQILEGEGKIEVYRNAVPIKMKLVSPREVHPLGKAMTLVASFLRPDGSEVVEIPEFPIGLTAKVIAPDGTESNVRFSRGEKGVCFGTPSVGNTKTEGIYKIILTMKGGDAYKSSQERIVQVKSLPYVMINKPLSASILHLGKHLSIEASLLHNTKPAKPEDEFSDHPSVLVLAQVVQTPNGGKSEAVWLDPIPDSQTPGQFYGSLPMDLKQKGRYVLMAKLAGQMRSGEDWSGDYSEVAFLVQPSIWQMVYTKWPWIISFFALIIIAFIIYQIQLPRFMGTLHVQQGTGEATSYSLRTFGHQATIGGSDCNIIIDPETKGKCGYIVAKRMVTEGGFKRSFPQIHYLSSQGTKTYTVRNLNDGDIVTINGSTLEFRF